VSRLLASLPMEAYQRKKRAPASQPVSGRRAAG